jgi:hypothetical protein
MQDYFHRIGCKSSLLKHLNQRDLIEVDDVRKVSEAHHPREHAGGVGRPQTQ